MLNHSYAVIAVCFGWIILSHPPAAVAQNIALSGRILWTDSRGGNNTHPVRFAPVRIWDARMGAAGLLRTVNTDAQGNYSATITVGGSQTRDIFIRVMCRSEGGVVRNPSIADPELNEYALQSRVHPNLGAGATPTINLTATHTADNNTAFSVREAVEIISTYARRLTGTALPPLNVYYPVGGSVSTFNGNLNIIGPDRWDWDVIMHEYGHFLARRFNLALSLGQAHAINEDLGARYGKSIGNSLAWAEGLPTYLAISAQREVNVAAMSVPNAGDTRYQDTEDSAINQDLESQAPSISMGEANELAVMRILFDLYDAVNAADGGDNVALGDGALWTALIATRPTILSLAWRSLTTTSTTTEQMQRSTVFSEHSVAPEPNNPSDGSSIGTTPPTFTWQRNGGWNSFPHDRFVVEFYNSQLVLLFRSPEITAVPFSYTPTQANWNQITAGTGSPIFWVVTGRNTKDPVTGPYLSRPLRLVR